MAVAGWLVWRADGGGLALGLWLINLVFNAAWSWLMFGRQKIRAALVDAVAMLVTIVAFIFAAWVVNKTTALLFFPYLAWVAFAAMLNWDILRRNPQSASHGIGEVNSLTSNSPPPPACYTCWLIMQQV